MWPFRKKASAQPSSGDSFQEFLRTHEPPQPQPIKNPIQEETLCPLCFERFTVGVVSADYPSCPDCASEGMEFGVEPLSAFLASKTLVKLNEIAASWQAMEGFLPAYKALKPERIQQLIALKLGGC